MSLTKTIFAAIIVALFATPVYAQGLANKDIPPGLIGYHKVSTASTNATSVYAGKAILLGLNVYNTNAATAYLKFYDKATAPTCNTDTVVMTFTVPQNVVIDPEMLRLHGLYFANGIGLCITANQADNDNTNATTGIGADLLYVKR